MTAAKPTKSLGSRSPKPARPNDIEDRIRRRAYELYEQRGRADSLALDDWLQGGRRNNRNGKAWLQVEAKSEKDKAALIRRNSLVEQVLLR